MTASIRSFIAFELPENVLAALQDLQKGLKNYRFEVKWIRPASIHLTLKFLGDIEDIQIDGIEKAMAAAVSGYAPLSLASRGVGVFPGIKHARVIWAGIGGQTDLLAELQQRLDGGLVAAGFKSEQRAFKGHLTLGRFKRRAPAHAVMQALQEFDNFQTTAFLASHLVLFRSELKPAGAVYTKLKSVPLPD